MGHETAIIRGYSNPSPDGVLRGAVLGNYDGLHLGHQALLKRLADWKAAGEQRDVSLVTLYPHPLTVLKNIPMPELCSLRQTRRLLSSLDIDYLHLLRFSEALSQMEAEPFIRDILLGKLALSYLLIGPDAAVGKDRAGTADVIQRLFQEAGATVEVQPFEQIGAQKIGSGGVREYVRAGAVANARMLLGRPYAIEGRVIHGNARGRTMNFPTANIRPGKSQLPAYGVYVTKVKLRGVSYDAVTNVGVRPTVGGEVPLVESFLLSYAGPAFYGERITISFFAQLRSEKKFSDVDALRAQIGRDVQNATSYLKHGAQVDEHS
jgi:riboflavin kinase/FMN adenylyltransferase